MVNVTCQICSTDISNCCEIQNDTIKAWCHSNFKLAYCICLSCYITTNMNNHVTNPDVLLEQINNYRNNKCWNKISKEECDKLIIANLL
jgi:hypothetical protein